MTFRYYTSSVTKHLKSKVLQSKSRRFAIGVANGATMLAVLFPLSVAAQMRIVPDGSTATTISTGSVDCTADCQITGTSVVGGNLFHSFSEFSIPAGVVVTFDDGGSSNIFTRVSDPGQASTILGNLSVSGAANFFLINPAGITFGPNASLNLNGGSFIASTAERLTFDDGNEFAAGSSATPVALTVSTPIGLQFGSTASPIVNRSQVGMLPSGMPIANTLGAPAGLRVNTSQTLALLGGDLTLAGGNLTALGGQIELGSVGPGSNVRLDATTQGFDFIYEDISTTQDIQLLGSLVDVGGPGGGQIHLQGDEITLDSSGLFGATFELINGGEIAIDATTFRANDSAVQGITFSTAQGSNLTFNVDHLSLSNGSVVSAETTGSGNSGTVNIQGLNSQPLNPLPTNTITLNESLIGSEVGPAATGQGGEVNLFTEVLNLRNAGILANTFGTGTGGTLTVTATGSATLQGDSQIATTADEFWQDPNAPQGIGRITADVGDAGDIEMRVGNLTVADGSQVQATTFGDAGDSGDVTIHANTVTLTGQAADGRSSGLFSQVEPGQVTSNLPQGTGGRILMNVETLRLLDGGIVSASALEGGKAGDIIILNADRIEIVGGNDGSSGLFAIGRDNGQAGNIDVSANQLRLSSQAQIAASTQTTDGGNVVLRLAEDMVMRGNSLVSARAGEGGSGGNVTIATGFLVGEPTLDSDIVASAINGPGGNIQISASGILGFTEGPASLGNGTNDIDASSQFGTNGTVTIENPETDPSRGLIALAGNLANLSNQVGQSCGAADSIAANQFVVTGRGGLSPTPAVALRERQLFADVGPVEQSTQQPVSPEISYKLSPELPPASPPQILEAQGWATNSQGEIALLHSITTPTHGGSAPGHLYASCQGTSN